METISASSTGSVPGSAVRRPRTSERGEVSRRPREVGEQAQRRAVAPVQVVDDQHEALVAAALRVSQ